MIFVYTFIGMILLGLVFSKSDISNNNTLYFLKILISIFGYFFLVSSIIIIIVTHATANYEIQKNKINYEGLCKRYEIVKSEYEDVSKSDVIADITAWNLEVYNTKYWTENPWTNWFNPKKIADNLYYIPLDEKSEE